jgi:hypothetical protein
MTTISSAAGAISALTSYYQAQSPAASTTDTSGEAPLASAMINLVEDNNTGSSLSSLLGTGSPASSSGASTLSTLLNLANSSNTASNTANLLSAALGNGSVATSGSLIAALVGQTSGASTATSPQQQAIISALAGAYSQNQKNLLSLLV